MEYIRVTKENLEQEHICCAISNNKDVQVSSKKAWLAERFDEGLVFLKSVERGKCFIEYIPAENAWNPIVADNYMYIDCLWVSGSFKGHGYSNDLLDDMYIDCLWVSGSFKGHGYSNDLLDECIRDSKEKGKSGLCILSSAKKKPFLADPKFLAHKGFKVCDEADNGIQLWYLPFSADAPIPQFMYYTSQCPFNAKYVPVLEAVAKEQGVLFKAIHLQSKSEAQNAPTPITTYAFFRDGDYLTNEQMNDKRFLKVIKC